MRRLRGPAVPVLYAALVFTPAVAAILVDPFATRRPASLEISVAFGFFAFALILLQFVLVSRIRWVSRHVNTDALVQLHQLAGLLSVALLVLHASLLQAAGLPWRAWNPLGGSPASQSGAVAFWCVAAIALTSVGRRRLRLSYEVWRVAHLALALIAASALVTHVLVVNGYTRAGSLRLLMIAFPAGASAVTLQYLIVRPLRLRRVPWSVVVNRDEGASVRTLRVLPAGHRGFGFDAGQFAWVITGRSPFSLQQHPLSISSSAQRPPDGTIEFSIKALGDWSGATVPALEPGELVWVDGPFGSFVPSIDPTRPLVLIAGGIGIAPMRSILATLRDRGDTRDVTLVYAAHDETRVAYRDQLDELSRLKQITLVYVFEEPDPSWSGARGFVTAALLRQVLGPAAAAADCFVCGPVPMMNAVEKALREIGVPPDSVHTERFQVI